jgi:hypothetical protein
MHGEAAGRPEHQHMIVVGAEVGLDGNDAVAARLVFDHDRLAPFGLQLFSEQPCADVGAGAGTERHDEFHNPRRPILRLCRWPGGNEQSERDRKSPKIPVHDVSPTVRTA